jgi:hypothetical protein
LQRTGAPREGAGIAAERAPSTAERTLQVLYAWDLLAYFAGRVAREEVLAGLADISPLQAVR